MRVLVVVNHLVPEQMELWRGAAASGADVHLVGALKGHSGEGFALTTAVPYDLPADAVTPRSLRPSKDSLWWVYPELAEVIRRVRPHVVHVHSEAWGLLALQTSHQGVPFVVHGANNIWHFGSRPERATRSLVARHVLRRSAGYVSWNSAGVAFAKNTGLRANAVTAVIPGILPPSRPATSPAQTAEARRRWAPVGSDTVIGFIGRAVPEKGLDVLMQAWERLVPDANSGARLGLVLVGHGTECYQGGPSVRAHGAVSLADAQQALSALDVLVVPSLDVAGWQEQFGRVVTEAFEAGVPVVVSDGGALPEVVADAGVVVPQGQPNALASALRGLADDPELRASLAAAGRRRRRHVYSREVLGATLVDVWRAAGDASSRQAAST